MSHPLCINDLKLICGSMKTIIVKYFGPRCPKLMLTSSSGQTLVTRDGMRILSSVHYSHPVSKCILNSVKSLCESYGDGCKTFIIYLDSLFEAIDQELTSQDHGWSLANSLQTFLKYDFVNITEELTSFVSSQNQLEKIGEETSVKHSLFCLMRTYFCNSFLRKDVTYLSKLLANYIAIIGARKCSLTLILQWFDNLVFCSKELYSFSHYVDGVFLKGHFSLKYLSNETTNAVLMQCPFELSDKGYTGEDCITKPSEKIITHPTLVATLFLSMLKKHQVTLLLTAHKVPDYLVQLASDMNINIVACLENSDLEFMMCATGKVVVSAMWDQLDASCLIPVNSYQTVDVAGQQYLKIVLERHRVDFPRSTLFLCAPTDGLHKELYYTVKKGLKLISHCLPECYQCNKTSNNSCSLQGNFHSNPNPHSFRSEEQQLADAKLSFNIVAGGGYFEYLLTHFLTRYMNTSVHLTPDRQMWCRLVEKMLLALPQNLYHNLNSSQQSLQKTNYLSTYLTIKAALDERKIVGFCSSISITNPLRQGVWECLDQKLATVLQVLHLAGVLLKVDSVVGAKSSCNSSKG